MWNVKRIYLTVDMVIPAHIWTSSLHQALLCATPIEEEDLLCCYVAIRGHFWEDSFFAQVFPEWEPLNFRFSELHPIAAGCGL
jgi:hypothetical protein